MDYFRYLLRFRARDWRYFLSVVCALLGSSSMNLKALRMQYLMSSSLVFLRRENLSRSTCTTGKP